MELCRGTVRFCKCVYLLEGLVMLCWVAGVVVLHMTQKPRHQGFSCDDETIRQRYHDDTVNETVLLGVSFALPLFCFVIVEVTQRTCLQSQKSATNHNSSHHLPSARPTNIGVFLAAAGVYVVYFFGYILQTFVGVFLKNLVGRLRPYFLDVCQPNVDLDTCRGLITEYTCNNTSVSESELKSIRQSFPSGHASTSIYMSLFLIFYLEQRLSHQVRPLLRLTLFAGLTSWALWCSVTRVTDNAHHVTDVIAGAIIGCVIAVVTFYRGALTCLRSVHSSHGNGNAEGGDIEQAVTNDHNGNNNNSKVEGDSNRYNNTSDEDISESMDIEMEAPTTPTPLLHNNVNPLLLHHPPAQRNGSFQLHKDKKMFRKFSLR